MEEEMNYLMIKTSNGVPRYTLCKDKAEADEGLSLLTHIDNVNLYAIREIKLIKQQSFVMENDDE